MGVIASNLLFAGACDQALNEQVQVCLKRDQFACVRGLVSEREIEVAMRAIKLSFTSSRDKPGCGESPQDVMVNFQKLTVGSSYGKDLRRVHGRFLRTFYNPLWEPDIYKMHRVFLTMIKLRNMLLGKPPEFASHQVEDGLWSACRIHQYPIGGGFMGAHQDHKASKVTDLADINYYQLVLIMTKKGLDFDQGGGYILHGNNRFIFEEYCQPGDIVIYDGSTMHGVDDVDPDKPLELDRLSGRLSALVSLYSYRE